MTRMLDGDYLNLRNIKFSCLDGCMGFLDRPANIDQFNHQVRRTGNQSHSCQVAIIVYS